jgi:hypothetical protein
MSSIWQLFFGYFRCQAARTMYYLKVIPSDIHLDLRIYVLQHGHSTDCTMSRSSFYKKGRGKSFDSPSRGIIVTISSPLSLCHMKRSHSGEPICVDPCDLDNCTTLWHNGIDLLAHCTALHQRHSQYILKTAVPMRDAFAPFQSDPTQ